MSGTERSRLEAEEAVLARAIERASAEVDRLTARRDGLRKSVEKLKGSIARLEAKGSRVITLAEYKQMRVDVVRLYRELASVELDLRQKSANLKKLRLDLSSARDCLRNLRRPKSL